MTYEQALQFWYGRINYEQRTLRMSDLKLERMEALLELLGRPHKDMPVVHIAGSKGKGSTAAMLAAILQRAHHKTGLFTSPHLCRIEERFQINGISIAPSELARLMTQVSAAVDTLDKAQSDEIARVTFFEIATALGFLYFRLQRVDLAVLEVGLGGRFDATNVCQPLVSAIASISLDHTLQLGNTLEQIAFEKAGIIKEGCPVVCGVRDAQTRNAIAMIGRQRRAPCRFLDESFRFRYEPGRIAGHDIHLPRVQVTTESRAWPQMRLALFGEHQGANAALAIACVEELRRRGFSIADKAVAGGLQNTKWPARLEVVQHEPLVILDCAHNVASAQALLQTIRDTVIQAKSASPAVRRMLIFATSFDKDAAGILEVLSGYFDHIYLTRFAHNPRCVAPEELAKVLRRIAPTSYTICESAGAAWKKARERALSQDMICITGSVFLAGEIRPLVV